MVFSLSIIPMLVMGGAAMDLSRAVREKTELQAATDAAALAAGRVMSTATQAEMTALATAHLTAGRSSPLYTIKNGPTFTDATTKDEICVTGQTSMPTTVMKLAAVNYVDLTAKSCAKKGGENYEIALVLDNSGSMKGSPLTGMKDASEALVKQLFPASGATGFVKLSIVPFGANVKAFDPDAIAESGNANEATRYNALSWMDQNGKSAVHWENWTKFGAAYPDITFKPKNRFELHANIGTKWSGCMETRHSSVALTDTPAAANGNDPGATQAQANTLYVPFFSNDNDDNNYLSDTGNSICTSSNNDPYKKQDDTIFKNTDLDGDKTSMSCKYKGRLESVAQPDTCTPDNNCPSSASNTHIDPFAGLIQQAAVTAGPASKLPSNLPSRTPSIGGDFASLFHLAKKGGKNDDDDDDDDDDGGGPNLSNCPSKPWKDKCKNACKSNSSHSWCKNDDDDDDDDDDGGPSCTPTQTCTPNPPIQTQLSVAATSDTSSKGPNATCDTPVVLPLSTDRATLLTAVSNQVATSRTNLAAGFLWGWKTISPNSPYAALAPNSIKAYGEKKNNKVIIMMTDGDHSMIEDKYSTFGFYWNLRLGAKSSNGQSYESYLDAKLQTACANAKAAGVTIYTIAYTDGASVGVNSPMGQCASPGKFMVAADGAALAAKFKEIGDSMAGIHLSK